MNKVDPGAMDERAILRERIVVKAFLCSPVVFVGPMVNKALEIGSCDSWYSVSSRLRLAGQPRKLQLLFGQVKIPLRDMHSVWGHSPWSSSR